MTASDADNSVEIEFDIVVKIQFFTEQIDDSNVKLSYDELDLYIEYVNKPLRVVGDYISTSKLSFGGQSYLNFSPLT